MKVNCNECEQKTWLKYGRNQPNGIMGDIYFIGDRCFEHDYYNLVIMAANGKCIDQKEFKSYWGLVQYLKSKIENFGGIKDN